MIALSLPRGKDDTLSALTEQIKAEYCRMANLSLTSAQARRLWSVDQTRCDAVLAALVDVGFLERTHSGFYIRS